MKDQKKDKLKGIREHILFLGSRNDVYKLYNAMDVFVFPSRYEGLGMAAVEAQFCGVRTLMSDRVPIDAKILDGTLSMTLKHTAKDWAKCILVQEQLADCCTSDIVRDRGFDISTEAVKLQKLYLEIYNCI